MSKKIFFDLDGTLYNLYEIDNWLDSLQYEDATVFERGDFIGDYERFMNVVKELLAKGFTFGVISWLPMYATPEFEAECAKVKETWVKKYLPFVDEMTFQRYGTPKQNAIQRKAQTMYLLDDSKEVGRVWAIPKQRIHFLVDEDFTAVDILEEILRMDY